MIIETAALISVGTAIATKLGDKGFEAVYGKLTSKEFNDKFYVCVEKAAKKLQKKYPDALGGSIIQLFKYENIVVELMNLLFIDDTIDASIFAEKFDTDTLPVSFITDFIGFLRTELHLDTEFRGILANKELYNSLTKANRNNELLIKEVSAIKNILEQHQKDESLQKDFLEKYTKNLSNNFCQINFIGLGINQSVQKGRRKNLKDLFVKPTFSTNSKHLNKLPSQNKTNNKQSVGLRGSMLFNTKKIRFKSIFNHRHRIVIVGNAGSGKSTLAKFIALSIVDTKEKIFINNKVYQKIPFRIELRKYYVYKKENGGNFINYLVHLLETEYAMPSLSISQLTQLINKKAALFIFDGLDEIFDIHDKIAVKNDIENFHNNFENIWSITTSRISGYEDAALNEKNTLKLSLNDFDDVQIETYIKKWYALEEDNESIRNDEVNSLLEKRKLIAKELISNPLLLSLIVILYRNNLRLPESRLEIYRSCTETLVEKWDDNKGLTLDLDDKIYRRKSAIFADLAFWQYEELSKEGVKKVTHERVKNTIANSLIKKIRIDEYEAAYHAEKFLNYAQKRSIYIENIFTHKTFLEYYTAYWVYMNLEKKRKQKKQNELISLYIENPFWHVVLELIVNFIDKDQPDDEIIDELVLYHLHNSPTSFKFFLNILPSLKNISEDVIQTIWKMAIMYVLKEKRNSFFDSRKLQSHITQNNINIIQSVFDNIYSVENTNKFHFFTLYLLLSLHKKSLFQKHFSLKKSFSKDIKKNSIQSKFNFYLYSELFENNISSYMSNLTKHFGFPSLFQSFAHYTYDYIFIQPIFNSYLISTIIDFQVEQKFPLFIIEMEKLGVKLSYILNSIAINKHGFSIGNEKLFQIINQTKNKQLELVLVVLFLNKINKNNRRIKIIYQDDFAINSFNFTKKSIKPLIEKIISLKDEREALTLIAEHYNMPALLEEYDENELKT